jgi:sugar lactone lactonase YvrE
MPAFGGADMKTLFVTTARDKNTAPGAADGAASSRVTTPGAGGGVYSLRVDVPGIPNPLFDPQI